MISSSSLRNDVPIVELSSIVEFLDHKRKPITESERVTGPYPYYGANGIQDYVADWIFDEELILLAEDGGHFEDPDRGVAYKISGKSWVNNHAHVLRPTNVDVDYLKHILRNMDLMPYVNGATRLKLTKANASRIKIPLPPLAEQKRIAELLDTADRILKQRESAIAKLDQLAQSVFVDMFQKHIKKLKLKDTCSFISGGTPSKDEPKFWNGDVAWISSADIEGDSVKEVRHFVTESAINNSATNPILPNNILVVTRTGVGKVVVTDRKFCFSQDITGLVLKKEFMPEFIAASLRNKQDEIVKQARGATIKGVTRDVIANVEIPAASFLEQQKFSERILQIDSLKKNYEIDRIKINVLLKSLQHQSFAVN
jgi:type I restriction enzyme, S subunit